MSETPDHIVIPKAGLDADAEATIRAIAQQARWEARVRARYDVLARRFVQAVALRMTADEFGIKPSKVRRLRYGC